MNIVAGIDGGGTATVLEFRDLSGKALRRMKLGPFNLNGIGCERFRQLLKEVFNVISAEGNCAAVCIGAAGISNPQTSSIIREEAAVLHDCKLLLHGDHDIALYGATGGKPGGILIAGTGSVCVGMGETGEIIRAGGWGHLIDDVGSGYALGRDALSAVAEAYDKRRNKTALTDLIYGILDISDIGGLISYIYGSPDKSRIAALSHVVEQAGRMGDNAAIEILERGGRALVKLIEAVFMQLRMETMQLSLLGGLLIHDTLLREAVIKQLSTRLPQVRIEQPKTDPAGGAALLAIKSLRACLISPFRYLYG